MKSSSRPLTQRILAKNILNFSNPNYQVILQTAQHRLRHFCQWRQKIKSFLFRKNEHSNPHIINLTILHSRLELTELGTRY